MRARRFIQFFNVVAIAFSVLIRNSAGQANAIGQHDSTGQSSSQYFAIINVIDAIAQIVNVAARVAIVANGTNRRLPIIKRHIDHAM